MSALALLTDRHRYYLYAGPADMRKSFYSLSGLVQKGMQMEVNAKDVFIFLNKRRTHIKLLLYEADGFTLFYRKLHEGCFTLPSRKADNGSIQLMATDIISMLSGLSLHQSAKRA